MLKAQLSGEKPQTERGDAVRNVYAKAASGWTAQDMRKRKKAARRLFSDRVDLKLEGCTRVELK